jgi:hypothetical protein
MSVRRQKHNDDSQGMAIDPLRSEDEKVCRCLILDSMDNGVRLLISAWAKCLFDLALNSYGIKKTQIANFLL